MHVNDLAHKKNEIKRKTVFNDLVVDGTSYVLNRTNFDLALYFNYYDEAVHPEVTQNIF